MSGPSCRSLIAIALVLSQGSVVTIEAKPKPEHPYRHSVLDIPVSLKQGVLRTPDFTTTKTQYYWIVVQVQKITQDGKLDCWLTTAALPMEGQTDWCTGEYDRLLEVEWTLWQGDREIASGTSHDNGYGKYGPANTFKLLANFPAKKGQTYTLELNFLKDATPIDINNPHLIVVPVGEE